MRALHTLPAETSTRLIQIGGERPFRRRLMELGFLPGCELFVVRNIDVGGVIEVEVRRCRVTLRRNEARELFVDQPGCTTPGCCQSNGSDVE
ncbi:MAG: ferrous iron transport protein A [Planctomycetota bacterium]|jgi:ferrous iron transport protein A